jgi:hypothetical protein
MARARRAASRWPRRWLHSCHASARICGSTRHNGGTQVAGKHRSPRVGPLHTLSDIRRELAILYRKARYGDIPIEDATRLTSILRVLGEVIFAADVEKRVDGIEKHKAGIGIRELKQLREAA